MGCKSVGGTGGFPSYPAAALASHAENRSSVCVSVCVCLGGDGESV